MSSTETNESNRGQSESVERQRSGMPVSGRRSYSKPRVVDQGRLVEITLGGSPGTGDSGPGGLVEQM